MAETNISDRTRRRQHDEPIHGNDQPEQDAWDNPEPQASRPVPPRRGVGRLGFEPALTPARPDLERFRDNLVRGMIKKNMTASDVARAMWGSTKNSQGNSVAKGRDRMTHYLAGKTYPNPENIAKLCEILELTQDDLAIDLSKSNLPPPPLGASTRENNDMQRPRTNNNMQDVPDTLIFQMSEKGFVDITFHHRVPLAAAFKWLELTRELVLNVEPAPDGKDGKDGADTSPDD